MAKTSHYVYLLLSGVSFGAVAYVLALFVTWSMIGPILFRIYHVSVRSCLSQCRNLPEEYRKANGRFPKSLKELRQFYPERHWQVNNSGEVFCWKNYPIKYIPDEVNPKVLSYGLDNIPGGVGLDIDISSDEVKTPEETLTFWQYATKSNLHYFMIVSIAAGLLAFLLFIALVRPHHFLKISNFPFIRLLFI